MKDRAYVRSSLVEREWNDSSDEAGGPAATSPQSMEQMHALSRSRSAEQTTEADTANRPGVRRTLILPLN